MDFPGKNTGVGSHALLQGIFPTQASNPGLPHCRLSYQGSPTSDPRKYYKTESQGLVPFAQAQKEGLLLLAIGFHPHRLWEGKDISWGADPRGAGVQSADLNTLLASEACVREKHTPPAGAPFLSHTSTSVLPFWHQMWAFSTHQPVLGHQRGVLHIWLSPDTTSLVVAADPKG